MPAVATRYDYRAIAFCYDELAAIYSLGRIARSKRAFLSHVRPGESVLVAGAGRGDDALAAARAGAVVTAVDRSGTMLGSLRTVAAREDLVLECIEAPVETSCEGRTFDHVVAHYFLNCFSDPEARAMLRVLSRRVGPGGRIHLADFAPSEGGRLARGVTGVYYGAIAIAGWALRLCALHAIPDLAGWLENAGFEVESTKRFAVGPGGAPAYWSITGRKRVQVEVDAGTG